MSKEVEEISIAELIPDNKNLNKGTEYGGHLLEKSFEQFGAGRSILLDKNNRIIAGNKATEKYGATGGEKVIVVETDGNTLVAVKRTDVDLDSKKGRELALADNATQKADLEWDDDMLDEVCDEWEIDEKEWGIFGEDEKEENVEEQEVKEDEYTEDVESRCVLGDVWQLGEHRLMCGDSTQVCDIKKIIGKEHVDLYLSDPPYGVKAVKKSTIGGAKPFGDTKSKVIKANKYLPIKGDDSTETARLNIHCVDEFTKNKIVFGGNYFTDFLPPSPCWLVWDKENTGKFADVEMAWTSFDKGAKLYKWMWNGLCRKGEREVELIKRVHPTQKPVGLLVDILNDFSKEGDIVLDCFGGSGSTLIACEKTHRKCFIIEYEPLYCDVIINRWETLTGKKAERIK